LLANLTGALRLLTGLGWPMIYCVAAFFHRRRYGKPMRRIRLEDQHSVEVVGLFVPLVYMGFVWWKATLTLIDAAVLIGIYVAYLAVLRRMPVEKAEGIDDLELVPRTLAQAPRRLRISSSPLSSWPRAADLSHRRAVPGQPAGDLGPAGRAGFIFVQWWRRWFPSSPRRSRPSIGRARWTAPPWP